MAQSAAQLKEKIVARNEEKHEKAVDKIERVMTKILDALDQLVKVQDLTEIERAKVATDLETRVTGAVSRFRSGGTKRAGGYSIR